MTCVWNALISSICCEDFHNILGYKEGIKPNPHEFVKLLKDRSINTDNVVWNDEELLKQQIDENFISVNQSGLKPGIYVIQIQLNNKISYSKVIIQ